MSGKSKVRLALLWHMHQPVYGLPGERRLRLPWVRMHALRGYLFLARLAERHPQVRQTVNLVPSLLAQAESYRDGCSDAVEELARIEPAKLNEGDKRLLLTHFFSINAQQHILPYPRYRQLLEEARLEEGQRAVEQWRESEWRDLQVWFHLSSLDADSKSSQPLAQRLIRQGRHFGESDKLALLDLYRQALDEIIPAYKKLWDQGTIEISTSPFYHPILPILCDAKIGRAANPALPDYDLSFRWPQDAELQMARALDAMENWFGRRPCGVWPSEGSISEEVLGIFDRLGVRWCASDEAVLEKSWLAQGRNAQPLQRNRPYHLPASRVAIFFRNHDLSDRLGFQYQSRSAHDAVEDFLDGVLRLAVPGEAALVSVILDGENPWEHYPHGGQAFLETLFSRLSEHPDIETVTFSEAAEKPRLLPKLLPGSWINGNFDIWIGDVQDRNAWRLVAETRARFDARRQELSADLQQRIMELLLRAEGSDWTWWYGSEHPTKDLLIFDGLLRDHLLEVYRLLGEQAPSALLQPVAGDGRREYSSVVQAQTRLIEPRLELRPVPFFEWLGAGRAQARPGGGSMHQVGGALWLEYGFSRRLELFLRCRLPEGLEGKASLSAVCGRKPCPVRETDLVCAAGELTARLDPGPKEWAGPLTIQLGIGERLYTLTLPAPDLRQLRSNWLV